jgi:nondiscriminating aspartyl-tRNA synthetase
MERIRSVDIGAHIGERILVQGWLHAVRHLGGITFIIIRDGWGSVQAVTGSESMGTISAESVIAVEGTVVVAAQAPGGIELRDIALEIITPVTDVLPITLSKRELKAHLQTLIDHAVITNRHPTRRAIFRMAASVIAGFRATLQAQHFTEIQTPKIVASATESGANVFQLDYFGRAAYLAQSPQLYKQIMVGIFERVYEVGPVFRAEPHDTTRHLNEYVSLDFEIGFIKDHTTVMDVLRDVLEGIVTELRATCLAEMKLLHATLPEVPTTIPSIDFQEAKELIWRLHNVDERSEMDLSPQDERWLGEWAWRKFGSDFLFVTGYPRAKRPFYTYLDPARPGFTNTFDLLFRGTELVSGGQRLHHYDDYLKALEEEHIPIEPFAWFLDAYRFGMPPHGGLGMGLERLLMQLTGLPNIKLASLFPRDLHRLAP